jgi:peptidylprolyl isomerase/FKBP-type peptidyl-prolyl cis-trans isomerase FklB
MSDQMKKYLFVWVAVWCAISFTSCGNDDADEIVDEVWKLENEKAFNDKTFQTSYSRFIAPSNNGLVYYKQIQQGNGKRIYYNSRVEVFYEGSLISGYVFDKKDSQYDVPLKVAVSPSAANFSQTNPNGYSSVIEGWSVVLQYMTEGEEGEVWIPQELAYGASDQTDALGTITIPAYSTLIFKMKVTKVIGIEEQ